MSAGDGPFLDTNVLVYVHDRLEPTKSAQAQAVIGRLLGSGWPVVSTQVVSEFYWTVTRKLRPSMSHDEAVREVKRLCVLTKVVPLTQKVVEEALEAVVAHQLPLWDAQIFAAALNVGCNFVLSEDFQHRRKLQSITFLNPFAADFDLNEVLTAT